MEKKRIPVRPHHGMCLAYFIGKGYSEGFSAHMEKMLHILEQDVSIRLVVSLDEICSACPNRQVTVEASGAEKEICEAQEKVYRYDHGVLDACGLAEGEELNFLEVYTESPGKSDRYRAAGEDLRGLSVEQYLQ